MIIILLSLTALAALLLFSCKPETFTREFPVNDIVNGNLLDKLKENNLHVIVTGVRPSVMVNLRLHTDYMAGVSLFK
ncbi:MAG: hypothetical protein ACTTKO_09745 [Candidatus Limimorpha sp.]